MPRRLYYPHGVCLVPPESARIIAVLLSEAMEERARRARRARRDAPFPRSLVEWLADDLQPFAAAQPAAHPVPTADIDDEWWTVTEAALEWGCSAAYVRRQASTGAIVARQVGRRWQVAIDRNRGVQTQPRRAG